MTVQGVLRRIVLTGGPCAGKSTVQNVLADVFSSLGWRVYRVPETATILLGGGVSFAELDQNQAYQFQLDLLKVMLHIEETYFNLAQVDAERGNNVVVICDRGAMDASAYIDKEKWKSILEVVGKTDVELRDERYDAVVHMVTAANGAESFYNHATNGARSEGLDLARHLDTLCQNAWIGHAYYDIVDNSTGFDEKCRRVVSAILSRLGLEDQRYSARIKKFKFLVDSSFSPVYHNFSLFFNTIKDAEFPVPFQDFSVDHTFLLSPDRDTQLRLRCRSQTSGGSHYTLTSRRYSPCSQNFIETRTSLPIHAVSALLSNADPTRRCVKKRRRCFLWKGKSFRVDWIVGGPCILEGFWENDIDTNNSIESGSSDGEALPPFIPIVRQINGEKQYELYQLALKDA